MSAQWNRAVIGTAAVVALLGLSALEIEARKVRIDLAPLAVPTWAASAEPTAPWQDFMITQGCLLGLELGPRPDCGPGH